MIKVIKRNGEEVDFNKNKIIIAITKAKNDTPNASISEKEIEEIASKIEENCENINRSVGIEEIQDMVENYLMEENEFDLVRNYIRYRYQRYLARKENTTDKKILSLVDCLNEEVNQENANKDPMINSTQRDYIAGEVSRDITRRYILTPELEEADRNGLIHIHDQDYMIQHMHNCCVFNLEDMLQNGTVISKTKIDKPKSFAVACNVTTQIMAQVASSQYGGQSITLTHIAPFVDISRKKIYAKTKEDFDNCHIEYSDEQLNSIVERRLRDEIRCGVQTIQYQILTLMTTNGQAPFVSIFMYLNEAKNEQEKHDLALIIEEMLIQRIKGIKNKAGIYVTPVFPKLLYVLEDDNIHENDKYWYLTELAAKCTAKRMVPDYISEKKMKEYKDGNCFPCMGCRSFLSVYKDENNEPKFYGRFNQGVCTINLVDVALSSRKNFDQFWEIFDQRLELVYKALMIRHNKLKGTKASYSPIHWMYGALARLDANDVIDPLLFNGYSTISVGYAGLYECTKYMTGKSHTQPGGTEFAIKVMEYLNKKCEEWKEKTNIGFSVYGTPLENSTYKFAKSLQKRFGIIKGITDHNYVTNSYHISVKEKVDAFYKLKFESQFQKLSSGGCISYVEVPDMKKNIPAILEVIKFIYENTMYAELNSKTDCCMECGFDGEIKMVEDENGKLIWECPNCGNRDLNKLTVIRRICGYLGANTANQGRMADIHDRVMHL